MFITWEVSFSAFHGIKVTFPQFFIPFRKEENTQREKSFFEKLRALANNSDLFTTKESAFLVLFSLYSIDSKRNP